MPSIKEGVILKLRSCIIALLGSFILAFGLYNVHMIANISEGGVLGMTLLLHHWFNISPSLSSIIMNGLCFILGFKTLGWMFLVYSMISSVGFSLFYAIFEQFEPLFPSIANYPLLAAIVGALFVGIGAGLCVRAGGAQSGDDALAMSLSHILKCPIQRIYLISDIVVLVLSISYIPINKIFYSLITVIISGQIIGWIQKK